MISDVDESLRRLLTERGNLNSGEVDISFDQPTREWAGGVSKPTVNLYLYDIRENTELRDPTPWKVRTGPNNTAVKSRPEPRIDLTYSITAFANASEDEHRLLSRILLTLFQHPVMPEEVLRGAVSGQEIRASVAQAGDVMQTPADYWGALDNDIRPAIDYRLTVRLDLSQEITAGMVLTSTFKVQQVVDGGVVAGSREPSHQIGGRIHRRDDRESGVSGATVTLLERALRTTTGEDGRYTFSRIPAGAYTIVVSAPGMDEQRERIEVPSGSYDVAV